MKHLRWDLPGFVVRDVLTIVLVSVGLYAFAACGAAQHPTVDQARAGLRLACDALAVATAAGTDVPAHELAAQACDVERTTAIMRRLVESAATVRQLVTEPPEWLDAPSSPSPGDAGAP